MTLGIENLIRATKVQKKSGFDFQSNFQLLNNGMWFVWVWRRRRRRWSWGWRGTSIRVRHCVAAGEMRVGSEWDVTPRVGEGWGAPFDRVWSKWAARVELCSYESGSEMEACGCQVPYRTLTYLIACRQVGGIRENWLCAYVCVTVYVHSSLAYCNSII